MFEHWNGVAVVSCVCSWRVVDFIAVQGQAAVKDRDMFAGGGGGCCDTRFRSVLLFFCFKSLGTCGPRMWRESEIRRGKYTGCWRTLFFLSFEHVFVRCQVTEYGWMASRPPAAPGASDAAAEAWYGSCHICAPVFEEGGCGEGGARTNVQRFLREVACSATWRNTSNVIEK